MSKVFYNKDDEPIILSKALLDMLLQQEHTVELIGLYTFYYYTAKWQKTNTPKATGFYTARGLQWSEDKVQRYKNILIDLGLIENVQRKDDSGKVLGHYIKVNFIWSHNNLPQKTRTAKTPPVEIAGTNSLNSFNINSLSSNKCDTPHTAKLSPKQFDKFWELYPNKKGSKGRASTEWDKICRRQNGMCPSWREIENAIKTQIESEQWQNPKYIPHASTWLHQKRWIDSPENLRNWDKEFKDDDETFEPMFTR